MKYVIMSWFFKSKEEKIELDTVQLRKLIDMRKQLLAEMDKFKHETLEDSKYWDRISEIIYNLDRINLLLAKQSDNQNLVLRRAEYTKELEMLSLKGLQEDAMYKQMNFEKKLADIDSQIAKLEKKLELQEAA